MNTFAADSRGYAAARPRYPDPLFRWIADHSPRPGVAWDCACGSGQAAVGLAGYFRLVEATDVSDAQLAAATTHPRVRYTRSPAESAPFPDNHVDCVAVAQALHWFDYSRWWAELRRVAVAGALFIAWGYTWPQCPAEVMSTTVQPFREIVAPFWPQQNRILWNGYRDADIDFPFDRIRVPDFSIELQWTHRQLVDYLKTWSAYQRSRTDAAAVRAMDRLLTRLPTREAAMPVRMPLTIVCGRVE